MQKLGIKIAQNDPIQIISPHLILNLLTPSLLMSTMLWQFNMHL